jgi:hypothetical protein
MHWPIHSKRAGHRRGPQWPSHRRSADDPLGNRVVVLPLPVVGRLTQFQQGVGFLLLLALDVNEVRPPHALLHAIVAGSKEVPCLGSPVRSVAVVSLQEFAGGIDHEVGELDEWMPERINRMTELDETF